MVVISTIVALIVIVTILYAYWRMLNGPLKEMRLKWGLVLPTFIFFLALVSALLYVVFTLIFSGTINAGTVMGMVLGLGAFLAIFHALTQ